MVCPPAPAALIAFEAPFRPASRLTLKSNSLRPFSPPALVELSRPSSARACFLSNAAWDRNPAHVGVSVFLRNSELRHPGRTSRPSGDDHPGSSRKQARPDENP